MTFDSSQLETFTKSINANNKWSLVNNCSKFVEKVWNSVATGNMKINAGFIIKTPSSLHSNIKGKSGYITKQHVPDIDATEVKRHTGNTVSSVSSNTLSGSSSS